MLDNDLNWKANYTERRQPVGRVRVGRTGTEEPRQAVPVLHQLVAGQRARGAAPSITGEVYKMELDGTIVGKFGRGGKALGEFSTIHQMDCRDPNVIFTAEINNWRSQKILLKPQRDNREPVTGEHMTRMLTGFVAAAVLAFGGSLVAQTSVQELAFDGNADLLRTPPERLVGEVGGVGANSKGQIFVYTRTGHPYATLGDNRTFYRGGSRLFQFDQNGKFVRELGQDVYGFNAAYGLRVDPQDNVWTIDIGANQVVKFDADGRVALVLGRKPETDQRPARRLARACRHGGFGRLRPPPRTPGGGGPAAGGRGAPEGRGGRSAGRPRRAASGPWWWRAADAVVRKRRRRDPARPAPASIGPTDVGWDKAGNIYVADGIGNTNRIAKFDKDGRFIKHWGSTGNGQGQFNGIEALVVDAQDNVYVADAGNKRIEVFDAEGNFKSTFANVGTPLAMCITRGATQYLYVSHVGDPDGMEDAAIYKVALDGKVRRQVRQGRQAAKGIRCRELDRLPQRDRAARRRDDQLARAEGHAEEVVGRTFRSAVERPVGPPLNDLRSAAGSLNPE